MLKVLNFSRGKWERVNDTGSPVWCNGEEHWTREGARWLNSTPEEQRGWEREDACDC